MTRPQTNGSPAADARVVVITGASSGFGLLASVELARRGLRVFASMRDVGKAGALADAARAAGVTVETIALDVTRADSIAAAVAEVRARAGRIDVLVNNAGIALGGFLEDVDMDELREQFETNFFGLVAMTKAVVPDMRARRSGRIINISSISGRLANPGTSSYCASKFAVEGLSESLRLELLPFGVHVVLVEPGSFKTDIFEKNRRVARRAFDPASPYFAQTKRLEAFVNKMLARSTADPKDVGRLIAHVATTASPRLRYQVGKDAHGEELAKRFVPYSLLERAILRYTGLAAGGA